MTVTPEVDIGDLLAVVRRVGTDAIDELASTIDTTQEFSPDLWGRLVELGVPGLPFAAADGGLGLGHTGYVQVVAELSYFGAVAGLYAATTVQVASAVLTFGNETQRERWGRRLVRGDALGAWAFTEPATGSDPRQITTSAERTSAGWLLNGGKAFISFAEPADVALVFARTSKSSLGAFLIDTSCDGWMPQVPERLLALGGMGTAAVVINDLEVSHDALIGSETDGFDILIGTESEGKVRAAAICLGIARRALHEAALYATQRTHRDVAIGDRFPTIQQLLGSMYSQVLAIDGVVRIAAERLEPGDLDRTRLAAAARVVAARAAREVTSDAMQVCGAYGFTKDMVIERLYREGKFYEVGQGVVELQRLIVGRAALREMAERGEIRRP